MAFTYDPFKESQDLLKKKQQAEQSNTYKESLAVQNARNALAAQEKNKPGDWTGGQYGADLKAALDKITNREAFSYDLNGDALYQQYKNQYVGLGKLAMQDTMGQAAALTGGYGNSYASTAGNQAYQGYLQQLNERVPELYQLAMSRYQMEGDRLKDNYAAISDMYGRDYGEYRDKVGDWNTELARLTDAYNNERNYDRGVFESDRTFYNNVYDTAYNREYGTYSDNYNRAFSSYQQQVAEDQYAKDMAFKQAQLAEEQRQFNAEMAYKQAQAASASTSSTKSRDDSSAKTFTAEKKDSIRSKLNAWNKVDNIEAAEQYLTELENDGYDSATLAELWADVFGRRLPGVKSLVATTKNPIQNVANRGTDKAHK